MALSQCPTVCILFTGGCWSEPPVFQVPATPACYRSVPARRAACSCPRCPESRQPLQPHSRCTAPRPQPTQGRPSDSRSTRPACGCSRVSSGLPADGETRQPRAFLTPRKLTWAVVRGFSLKVRRTAGSLMRCQGVGLALRRSFGNSEGHFRGEVSEGRGGWAGWPWLGVRVGRDHKRCPWRWN